MIFRRTLLHGVLASASLAATNDALAAVGADEQPRHRDDLFFIGTDQIGLAVATLGWGALDPHRSLQRAASFGEMNVTRLRSQATAFRDLTAPLNFILCAREPSRVDLADVARELSVVGKQTFVVLRAAREQPERLVELAHQLQLPVIVPADPTFDGLAEVVTALGTPIVVHGYMSFDFEDFSTVCCGPGAGRVFHWVAKTAANEVPSGVPLEARRFLSSTPVRGFFLQIACGRDVSLSDINDVLADIQWNVDPEADCLFHSCLNEGEASLLHCWLTLFHS